MKSFDILAEEGGSKKRLDRYLAEKLSGDYSRSFIQKLIEQGHITLNAKPAKSNIRVMPGDKIHVVVPPPEEAEIRPEEIPLDIVYEDKHLIVVNKPAGMVVHPAVGNWSGTMVNALMAHCKDLSGMGGSLRPGIVHRLDKETSGLIVAAKDDFTHRKLANQFKVRTIKRKYVAFVKGVVELDDGTIDLPIGRHKRDRQKMAVEFSKSKEAITHYAVLKRYDDYTMLELVLGTGRTHQIRTHLEYLGYPLLGDKKYGKSSTEKITRHALHAATLGFKHPMTKEFLEFTSDLPPDMQHLC